MIAFRSPSETATRRSKLRIAFTGEFPQRHAKIPLEQQHVVPASRTCFDPDPVRELTLDVRLGSSSEPERDPGLGELESD